MKNDDFPQLDEMSDEELAEHVAACEAELEAEAAELGEAETLPRVHVAQPAAPRPGLGGIGGWRDD